MTVSVTVRILVFYVLSVLLIVAVLATACGAPFALGGDCSQVSLRADTSSAVSGVSMSSTVTATPDGIDLQGTCVSRGVRLDPGKVGLDDGWYSGYLRMAWFLAPVLLVATGSLRHVVRNGGTLSVTPDRVRFLRHALLWRSGCVLHFLETHAGDAVVPRGR